MQAPPPPTTGTQSDQHDAVLANAQLLDLLRGVAEAGRTGGVLQRILAHIAGRVGADGPGGT